MTKLKGQNCNYHQFTINLFTCADRKSKLVQSQSFRIYIYSCHKCENMNITSQKAITTFISMCVNEEEGYNSKIL